MRIQDVMQLAQQWQAEQEAGKGLERAERLTELRQGLESALPASAWEMLAMDPQQAEPITELYGEKVIGCQATGSIALNGSRVGVEAEYRAGCHAGRVRIKLPHGVAVDLSQPPAYSTRRSWQEGYDYQAEVAAAFQGNLASLGEGILRYRDVQAERMAKLRDQQIGKAKSIISASSWELPLADEVEAALAFLAAELPQEETAPWVEKAEAQMDRRRQWEEEQAHREAREAEEQELAQRQQRAWDEVEPALADYERRWSAAIEANDQATQHWQAMADQHPLPAFKLTYALVAVDEEDGTPHLDTATAFVAHDAPESGYFVQYQRDLSTRRVRYMHPVKIEPCELQPGRDGYGTRVRAPEGAAGQPSLLVNPLTPDELVAGRKEALAPAPNLPSHPDLAREGIEERLRQRRYGHLTW